MEWAGNSSQVLVEYLDRLQQHNQLMLADARTGETKLFFEDTDKAWVDDSAAGLDRQGGKRREPDLLWISERDGWRHAYRVDRTTGQARLLTNFAGRPDLGRIGMDAEGGWLYFIASPEDATAPVPLPLAARWAGNAGARDSR